MKLAGVKIGLLINFDVAKLKDGIKRLFPDPFVLFVSFVSFVVPNADGLAADVGPDGIRCQ